MSNLPIINVPSSNVNLPVMNKKIRVKAFQMKTLKNMSLMSEAGESDDILFTIKNIVSNSIVEPENFDPGKLNITDLTVIFLKLVELSKGPEIVLRYKCQKNTGEKDENNKIILCNQPIEVIVNISDYEIVGNIDKNKLIQLTEEVGVTYHYPSIDEIKKSVEIAEEYKCQSLIALIAMCIDDVYVNKKEVEKNWKIDEVIEWVYTFPTDVIAKLDEKFSNIPIIKKDVEIVCEKCGNSMKVTLSTLEDFFGSGFRGIR